MGSSTSPLLHLLLLLPFLDTAASSYPLHYFHSSRIAADPPQQAQPGTPLAAILSNLGFQELSMGIPFVASILSSPWSSPVTIFAPSDDSIRSCGVSCSPARLLMEHTVAGVFPFRHLSKLTFGTKLETASPSRCLTITSAANSTSATAKIFVEGVEITRPDLFNDGKIVIHGIQGFVAPLTAFSCLSAIPRSPAGAPRSTEYTTASLMIHDAIVRLRAGGYSILALAMRIKSPELVGLKNMTVFALDDPSIFAGGHAYLTEVRFHIVPNQLLMHADLAKLPEGTVLPTLVRGQHLVVTQSALSGPFGSGLRINYVPIKNPDVVFNSKIVVHSLFFPFPHLYLVDRTMESSAAAAAACWSLGSASDCTEAPSPAPAAAAAPPASVTVNLDLDRDAL